MENKTLIGKIAKISLAVGSLSADARNTQQKYDYISADKILDRVGKEMAKEEVVIIPAIVDEEIVTVPWKQGARYDVRVDLEMTVTDGDSEIKSMWFGRGSDYSVPDKAMYKAITSGHKYFLMKL